MLEQGQEDYLRELTKGFSAERLGRVYNDYEKKTFEVLPVLAQKEKREKEKEEMEGSKRAAIVTPRRVGAGVRGRGPPTPSSSNDPGGRKNNRLSIRRANNDQPREKTYDDFEEDEAILADTTDSSDFEKDSSSNSSLTSNDQGALIPTAGPQFPTARLDRVEAWTRTFKWSKNTSKTDLVDYCWKMEQLKHSRDRLFSSRDSVRVFMKRWSETLGGRSQHLARLYSDNLTVVNKRSPRTTVPMSKYPRSLQIPRKRRHSSYGPSSFVASDSEEEDFITQPDARGRDTGFKEYQGPTLPDWHGRVHRTLQYANSYTGWDSMVKLYFYRWVVDHEQDALRDGTLTEVDALKTEKAVDKFLVKAAVAGAWDHCAPLKALVSQNRSS